MSLTPEQQVALRGTMVIRCIKVGGVALSGYGGQSFAEDETLNLLDPGTPDAVRAADYSTAQRMCLDMTYEIAQKIDAGEMEVASDIPPDISVSRYLL